MNCRKRSGGTTETCSLTEAAAYLSAQGKYAAAERSLLQIAKSLRRAGSGSRRERAVVWNALGIVCKYLGKFRSAERYYQQALRSARYLTGCDSLLADLYHNLGGLEHSRRHFERAEKFARGSAAASAI
jgi:tetratricopeptide (TPR) repeat protein